MRGLPFANVVAWEDVRHVVIIPNYKESESKLRQTLTAMAATDGARENVIPILAMEGAEPGAALKAQVLLAEFAGPFYDLLVTYHPYGLLGEVRGKSSNEAWAARDAVAELVERRGLDIDHLTVTSCDADTIFPPQYFECLTYHFATDPRRYRRFWQAPIFFYNNIWQVPAPLRVPNAIAGLVHLSRLTRQRKVLFSQSTYSLSMRMAHDVGYWDTDIIPEDWHMFLKCFYNLGGNVDVEPIHLPVGNDGALSHDDEGDLRQPLPAGAAAGPGARPTSPTPCSRRRVTKTSHGSSATCASGTSSRTTSAGRRSGSSSRSAASSTNQVWGVFGLEGPGSTALRGDTGFDGISLSLWG